MRKQEQEPILLSIILGAIGDKMYWWGYTYQKLCWWDLAYLDDKVAAYLLLWYMLGWEE